MSLVIKNCNKAIHAKCYKNAKFCCIDELWLCQTCTENSEPRYNPFPKNLTQGSCDKFYDEIEPQANDPAIKAITKVLGNCKSYTAQEFKLSQSNIPKQIVTSSKIVNPYLSKWHLPFSLTLMVINRTLINFLLNLQ